MLKKALWLIGGAVALFLIAAFIDGVYIRH